MEASSDFEDMLAVLEEHQVRYLIIGGLAFIYHAKPRYTKDIDIWIDPERENVTRTNRARADFGSPYLLDPTRCGRSCNWASSRTGSTSSAIPAPPSRRSPTLGGDACAGPTARVTANWIDLDGLLEIKSRIDHPRHQEDARVLRMVKESRGRRGG